MKSSETGRGAPGRLVETGEGARTAFVPRSPCPQTSGSQTAPFACSARHARPWDVWEGWQLLPTRRPLISPLQTQEAVLSNRIEGTRASSGRSTGRRRRRSRAPMTKTSRKSATTAWPRSRPPGNRQRPQADHGAHPGAAAQLLREVRGKDRHLGRFARSGSVVGWRGQ